MPLKSLDAVLKYHNEHLGRIDEYEIRHCLRCGGTIEQTFPRFKPLLLAAKLLPANVGELSVIQVKGTSFRPPAELAKLRHHDQLGGAIRWEVRPEPTNEYDPNAIAVYAVQGEDPHPKHILTKEVMVGYVAKEVAAATASHSLHIAGHLSLEELGKNRRPAIVGQPFSIQLLCAFAPKVEQFLSSTLSQ